MEEEKPIGLIAEIRMANKPQTREEMNQAIKEEFSKPWSMPRNIIMGSAEFIEEFTSAIEEYDKSHGKGIT